MGEPRETVPLLVAGDGTSPPTTATKLVFIHHSVGDSWLETDEGGLGNALMSAFGLKPSRRIGDIRRALEQRVAAGELPAGAEPEVYVDYVRHHRSEFGL